MDKLEKIVANVITTFLERYLSQNIVLGIFVFMMDVIMSYM